MGHLRSALLGVVCFGLGAGVTRYYDTYRVATPQPAPADTTRADVAAIDFSQQPLWAYGFDRPPVV